LYLLALAALPFAGIAPLGVLNERSSWTDVCIAAAAVVWLLEVRPRRSDAAFGRLRGAYVAVGVFVALTAASAMLADDRRKALVTLLLTGELVVLMTMTAYHGRTRSGRNAIVVVMALGALATVAMAAVGLALFYLGLDTPLIGAYGEQFVASDAYARVAAGFGTPPLLADYCIVAAAIVVMDSDVPRRLRRAVELALAIVVVLTLSRAILGFFVAVAMRAAYARGSRTAKLAVGALAVLAVATMAALTAGRLQLDPTRPSTISYELPDPGNRRQAFATSLQTLAAHPLLGLGPGTYPGENRGTPFRAHFTPLNIAATVGLPALLALATALTILWRRRPRPTEIALWSGLAGVAIDALGQDVEHFRHVWILIGLAAASASFGDQEQTAGKVLKDRRLSRLLK
jgi:O-antigen ligase